MTSPISHIAPIATDAIASSHVASQPGEFQKVLSSAIQGIQSQQDAASSAVQKFLTGENEELHTTILATQKAEIALDLGLQVRNKIVDAYQEIMKMQM